MKNKLFLLLTIPALITSCFKEKEIDYNREEDPQLLVLNGIIENDSTIAVSVEKSTFIFGGKKNDKDQTISENVELVLVDNTTQETFVTSQMNADKKYEFNTTAKVGHSYSISVKHLNFAPLSATTSIPEPASILDWDTSSMVFADDTIRRKNLKVKWKDVEGKSFYVLQLMSVNTYDNSQTPISPELYDADELSNAGSYAFFFNDQNFTNGTKELTLQFTSKMYIEPFTQQKKERAYRIELLSLSEEAFLYLLSICKLPTIEPMTDYTNVANGLGIFGGISKSIVLIE